MILTCPHSRSIALVTLLDGDGSPTDLLHEAVRALELRGEVQHLLVIYFLFGRQIKIMTRRPPAGPAKKKS